MRKGFTLVEIMIVVAIIALLSAIAIPNLLRARLSAQEAAAAASLRTIAAAEIQYRATNPTYATLAVLGSARPPYIDTTLASGRKQGYDFTVVIDSPGETFAARAVHVNLQGHSFYIDEDGILCRSTAPGAAAAAHEGTNACPAGYAEVQ